MFNKRLFKLISGKRWIAATGAAKFAVLAVNIGVTYTIAEVLQAAVTGAAVSENYFLYSFLALGFFAVLRLALSYIIGIISKKAMDGVKRELRKRLYLKLLSPDDYKKHIATSEAMQLSTEGVEQIEGYVSSFLPQLFYSLLAPVAYSPCLRL